MCPEGASALELHPELFRNSVRQLGAALRTKQVSASELLHHFLNRIERLNRPLNAFVYVDHRGALEAARQSDARLRAGAALSELDGIPVAVKDNLLMRDCPAAWGSPLFREFVPDHDELPVAKLRSSGAVLLGKTNVPEFAMRGHTANAVYGVTRNPWNMELTPGGSSGGAVAAVAAGLVPVALATDGGGSIRRPCAYTNLVGLKPSIGRIRRAKGFPQLMLDCEVVGPIGRRADDVRLTFANLAPSSVPVQCHRPTPNVRILYVGQIKQTPVDPEVRRLCASAAERFRLLGHDVTFGDLPFAVEAAISAWRLVTSGGFAALARRHHGFSAVASADFTALAQAGERLSAADYCDAVQVLFEFRATVAEYFDGQDLVMTPAVAARPWSAEQPYPSEIADQPVGPTAHAAFTPWVNACGHPAIALPAGIDRNGLPVGFQLIAPNGQDQFLLDIAAEYEAAFPWESEWPKFALA